MTAPYIPDLITQGVLASALGDNVLTATQTAYLQTATTNASRLIRKHCNRVFNRAPSSDAMFPAFDGLYSFDGPSRQFLLKQFPVNGILRCSTDLTPVLTINQTNTSTYQRANVTLNSTVGWDLPDMPPAVVSVRLNWVASGVPGFEDFAVASCPTLSSLIAAVNTFGSGWTAVLSDPSYALYATADFRPIQSALPALGQYQAELRQYITDVPCQVDPLTGLVDLSESDRNDPWSSPNWGPDWSGAFGDELFSGSRDGFRVVYDAGWDTVPGDVQQACVETVWDMLNCLTVDQRLGSESDGARSVVQNTAFANYALPKSALGKLAYYRNTRA